MKSKLFGAVLMAAVMAVPVFAQDAATKKRKGQARGQQTMSAQLLKQLEELKLTEDQVAKIKELGKTMDAKAKALRDEAGITPELMKKRAEAQKSLKDSGKKGKDLMAAVNETAGFNEAQTAAMQKINEARTAFQKQVVAMLSDEQKEKIPEALKRAVSGRGAGAKPNKKKPS
jgi:hypothetical protein